MILLDTTFLIDAVNGDAGAAKLAAEIDRTGAVPSISIVSAHEYMMGAYLEHYGTRILNEKVAAAKSELERFRVLPLTKGIAMLSAKISANLFKKGKEIGMNDIYIAATALYYSADLISRNTKHFGEIPGLRLRGY